MPQFSYETIGNACHLVATFEGGKGVINYQLQMIDNNDIRNIIRANKRKKNEDVIVSYNITSKIALSQLDAKTKIPKKGLINIIEGALTAIEDVEEYQLVTSGIVFDEKYIYVNPGNYEPYFIYLPNSMEDSGIEPLRQLILSLIMGSKVEMTGDSFIQTLLDTLNKPGFSAKDLRKLCNDFKSNVSDFARNTIAKQPETKKEEPQNYASAGANQSGQSGMNSGYQNNVSPVTPVNPVRDIPNGGMKQTPNGSAFNIPGSNGKPQNKPEKKATNKTPKGEKPKGSSKKSIFIVLQIVFLIAVIGVVLSGVLNDAEGNLNITYLFAVVMVVAVADFVIYREMFVNNKDKSEADNKKKKETSSNKGAKNGKSSVPTGIPGKMTGGIPGKMTSAGNGGMNKPNIPGGPVSKPISNPNPQPTPEPKPIHNNNQNFNNSNQFGGGVKVEPPAYATPTPVQSFDSMNGFESEDTVVMSDNVSGGAYLEYYENGLSTKIRLDKDSVMIGKLRGQCDFVISNNKISKMHAEFIKRGNEYFVRDYNSTNGTYINGSTQRIASNTEYQIYSGDRITLANVDLTLMC